jgi:hypothetical protein
MKKIMLLATVSLLAVLLLPTVALAEHSPSHVRAGSDGSPNTASPSATEGIPKECSDFADPQTAQELDQDFGLNCASPDPSPTASPGPTASPTASPAASQYISALPETGGPSPLPLVSVALLVATLGALVVGVVRRD